MKILGRELSAYKRLLAAFHKYIWYFIKCFLLFKKPIPILYCYLTKTSPKNRVVELRNGLKIFLSEHPLNPGIDMITVFLVFAREDYGEVQSNSVVIDIGANIGVFSLYAAYNGARAVYAYEPNTEFYECLLRNISENNLEDVIIPYKLAVSGVDGDTVKFPVKPSLWNAIITDDSSEDFELVKTTTLEKILSTNSVSVVDLLKLDCEGAEYDILFTSNDAVLEKIRAIRLEYHRGWDNIVSFLMKHGFEQSYIMDDRAAAGIIWLDRI